MNAQVMNAFPVSRVYSLPADIFTLAQNGTRIFYWDVNGTIKYGTVRNTSRMTDVSH